MVAIKPMSSIAAKWKRNASGAGDSYREGVASPRADWAQATVAADSARKEGLAAADARDAFVKGVNEAGTARWKNRATEVGPARYRQGVQVGEPEFSKGFAPIHSVIAGVTLPPRGSKGSPENYDRVRTMGEALHAAKISK